MFAGLISGVPGTSNREASWSDVRINAVGDIREAKAAFEVMDE